MKQVTTQELAQIIDAVYGGGVIRCNDCGLLLGVHLNLEPWIQHRGKQALCYPCDKGTRSK